MLPCRAGNPGIMFVDEGKALSTLRPVGKAKFKNQEYEVKTLGDYVDNGTPIRIKLIMSNQIIVEPIN